ncbi:cysteine synthase B [Candidatus Peregrinibacteria bacterium CG_4_10_14_0_2_um_filter_43_11]|nr:MAG: cysteine synthase B [Candidatus Peregrinibacteria bacterium CG_4_10_14_0_2_um_filter_43_11]
MIEKAEKSGELTHQKTILEATSGNMGIALAMIGAHKKYKVTIVMSEGVTKERRAMIKAFGAKLLLTPSHLGTKGALLKVKKMIKSTPKKYWFANQFNTPANTEAHYHGIAPELLRQIDTIDFLIGGIGTGGTMMGIAKYFQKYSLRTKIIVALPPEGYGIQGIQNPNNDFKGNIYESEWIDEFVPVSKKEAMQSMKKIAQKEGLFVGMSSGAILAAMEKTKKRLKGNVVILSPDRGKKYMSALI